MRSDAGYYPAVDGLRGVSIVTVLVGHTFVPTVAGHGVSLFFAISGFLITGILLRCRDEVRNGGAPRLVLAHFYIRRALRILPVYYGVLVLGAALGLSGFRETFPWLVLHASNFFIWWKGAWIGSASHFWSLATEEQFYRVWPLLVLFSPARLLIPLCIGFALLACLTIVAFFNPVYSFYMLLPTSQGGFLGMGGLAALLVRDRGVCAAERVMRPAAAVGTPACLYGFGIRRRYSLNHIGPF